MTVSGLEPRVEDMVRLFEFLQDEEEVAKYLAEKARALAWDMMPFASDAVRKNAMTEIAGLAWQVYMWMQCYLQVLGYGKDKRVKPLSELIEESQQTETGSSD